MKINFFLIFAFFALLFSSCAGLTGALKPEAGKIEPEHTIPERVKPLLPEHIMGQGQIPREKLINFLLNNSPWTEPEYAEKLSDYYIEEAAAEGVNYDIAFVQMCLETGFLSFGGLVSPDMNNFCGLGSTGLPDAYGNPERGLSFPDPRMGVRAHIQHLKAYGSDEALNLELVDPRFRYVRRGSAPTFHGLAGTWAADPQYGNKLGSIMQRIYNYSFTP